MNFVRQMIFMVCILAGCGTLRYYPMPIPAGEAPAIMPSIATAASNLGYRQWSSVNEVHVSPNVTLDLFYHLGDDGSLKLTMMLKDKNASEQDIAAGKATADQLFGQAVALRRATGFPSTTVVVQPEAPKPGFQINIGR